MIEELLAHPAEATILALSVALGLAVYLLPFLAMLLAPLVGWVAWPPRDAPTVAGDVVSVASLAVATVAMTGLALLLLFDPGSPLLAAAALAHPPMAAWTALWLVLSGRRARADRRDGGRA